MALERAYEVKLMGHALKTEFPRQFASFLGQTYLSHPKPT